MAHIDGQYYTLCQTILNNGFRYEDKSRANIGMIQIPNYTLKIDMLEGFPLLTTKKIYWKTIAHELIWMLSGSTTIDYLMENGVKIWDKDAHNYSGGSDVGRIYGAQWKFWTDYSDGPLNQISTLIRNLKHDLYGRRHIVTAWNPAELDQMALPPCHWSFEIIPVSSKGEFALKWHQRSCDTFLGIPFDIGLYAMLGKLIQRETGLGFRTLIGDLSNVHFYEPHLPMVYQQLGRGFLPGHKTDFVIDEKAEFTDLKIEDLSIINYQSLSPIKAQMYAKVLDENAEA